MGARRWLSSLGLLAILALSSTIILHAAASKAAELEGLDAPEDEVVPQPAGVGQDVFASDHAQTKESKHDPAAKPRAAAQPKPKIVAPAAPRTYHMEIVAGVVVLLYVIVALLGTRGNDAIAQAFARQHCVSPDSIFPRQFAMCGAGDPGPNGVRSALVKESTNTYKFYASGRRHCQGLLATLVLKNRADLLGWLLGLFFPQEDLLEIEVYVSDMSPMVMAVATPRQAKALQDRRDVRAYTKPVKVQPQPGAAAGGDGVPSWNNAKLQVLAEHSSFFYDLFGEPRLHGIFTSAAHADKLRLFRSLLVSSENGGGQKQVLRFVFALPSADDMAALAPLLALVPLLTDLVAMYRVNPELKKKLAEARARTEEALAEAEEARKKRVEALQRKKIEKALEEKERLARLNPEARRKAEEKLAKQAAKKGMKVKMVRM